MLKRLSYPLSWVEGFTGEATAPVSQSDSLPTSADSHNTSVFSKVFNRYVHIALVDTMGRPGSGLIGYLVGNFK